MDIDVAALDETAQRTRFTGVVAVIGDGQEVVLPYGLANRTTGTPVTAETRFATASGSKSMTAIAVGALVEDGTLALETRVRDLLGDDLPLIDDGVTVRHLLSHTSGIGDYLDEDADDYDPTGYVLSRPVQEYLTAADFLGDLDGHPQAFAPGARFAYCNGGYLVLALIAERASGTGYHDLVRTRVLEPSATTRSGFFRSDSLPFDTATGYLDVDDDRSNVFHLPILGGGDGGMYTTAADTHLIWTALLEGRLVSPSMVEQLLSVQAQVPDYAGGYGFGFWLHRSEGRLLPTMQGEDAGVSFRSRHVDGVTRTVLSSTADGAWDMWDVLMPD